MARGPFQPKLENAKISHFVSHFIDDDIGLDQMPQKSISTKYRNGTQKNVVDVKYSTAP